MPRKEGSGKAKEWERERRERLNESFNLLSSLLPCYDPSITKSKIEILQKAISYITDVQKEKRGSTADKKGQAKKQVGRLKLRIDNLLRRIQQLSSLLKDAGISIPPEVPKEGLKVFNGRQYKWSNKVRPEDIAVLLKKNKKPAEKKNASSKSKAVPSDHLEKKECNGTSVVDHSANHKSVSSPTSKRRQRSVSSRKSKKVYNGREKKSKCKELQNCNKKKDKADMKNSPNKCSLSKETSADMAILDSNVTVLTPAMPQVPRKFTVISSTVTTTSINQPSCFVLASAPQPMPSYNPPQTSFIVKSGGSQGLKKATLALQPLLEVVPNAPPVLEASVPLLTQKKGGTIVVTNSHLLTAPIMATGIQTCPAPSVLPTQGVVCPGTFILANGSVVPILPASNTSELIATKCNSNMMNQASCIPALPENPILLMQNSVQSASLRCDKSIKPCVYPLFLPKPLKTRNDFTKTTFVNKVPISAVAQKSNIRVQSSSRCTPFPQVSVNKPSSKTENTKNTRRSVQGVAECSNKEIVRGINSKPRSNNKKLSQPILKDLNSPNSNKTLKKCSERKVVLSVSSDHTSNENIVEPTMNKGQDPICPPLKGEHLTSNLETKCTKVDKSDNSLDLLTSQKGKRVSVKIEEAVSNKRAKFDEDESPDKSDSLCLTSGSTSDGISLSFADTVSAVPINSIHFINPIVISDTKSLATSVISAPTSSVVSLSSMATAISSPTPRNSTLHTCTSLITPASSNVLVYSSCVADTVSVSSAPLYVNNSGSMTTLSSSIQGSAVAGTVSVSSTPLYVNNSGSMTALSTSIQGSAGTSAQTSLLVSKNLCNSFVLPKTLVKSSQGNFNNSSFCSLSSHMSSNNVASVQTNTDENVITPRTIASSIGNESNVNGTIEQAIKIITSTATQTSTPVTSCGTIVCNVVATPMVSIATTASTEDVSTVPGEISSSAATFKSNCSAITVTAPFSGSYASVSSVNCMITSASANTLSYANPTGSLVSTSFNNTMSSVEFVDGNLPISCSSCTQAEKVVDVGITAPLKDNENKPVSNPNVFSFTLVEEKMEHSNNRNIAKGSGNYSIDCLCRSVVKNQMPNNINSLENISNSGVSKDNCEQCKPLISNDLKVSKVANISNNLPSRPSTFSIKCVMESVENKAGKGKPLTETNSIASMNTSPGNLCVRNKSFHSSTVTLEKKQEEGTDCHSSKSVKDLPSSWNGNVKTVSKNRERKLYPLASKQSEPMKKMLLSNSDLEFNEKQISLPSGATESPNVHLQVTTSESTASNSVSLSERLGAESVPDAQNIQISQQMLSSAFFSTSVSVSDKEPRLFPGNPSRNSSLGPDFVKSNNSVVYSNCDEKGKKSEGSEETEVLKNDFSQNISSKLSSHSNYNTLTPISVSSSICSSVNVGIKENANVMLNTVTPACLSLQNNEFSNDLFSSLQVPHSEHHSESTSPTAAFLLTFPVVTSSKVSEIMGDSQDIGNDSVIGTSNIFHVESNSDTRLDIMNPKTSFQSPCKKSKKLTENNFTNDIAYSTFNAPQEISKQFIPLESSYKMYESNTFLKDGSREMNSKNWSTLPLNSENKILNEESNRSHIRSQSHIISDCVVNQQQNLGKPQKFSDIFMDANKSSTEIFSSNTCVESVSHNVIAPLTSNLQPFPGNNFAMPSFNTKISGNESGKVPTRGHIGLSDSVKEQSSESVSGYKESSQTHISTSNSAPGSVVSRINNRDQDSLSNNSVPYSQYLNQESTSTAYPKYPLNSSYVALEVARASTCPQPNRSAKSHANSYLPTTSSCGYMVNHTSDTVKCPPATSFSVANSSSNFSILSWTTLSPMTTVSNKHQCNEFFPQSTQTSTSHQNVTDTSKKFNNQVCLPENSLLKSLEFHDMYNLQQKHSGQDAIGGSSIPNKTQESFSHSLLTNHSKISGVNQPSHPYSNNCKSSSTNEKNIRCHTSEASSSYPGLKTSLSEPQNHFSVNWAPVPNICPQQFPSNSTSNETYHRPVSSAVVTHVDTDVRKDMGMCNINGSSNLFSGCVPSTCPSFDTKTFTSNSSSTISSNAHGSYQASTQSKENIISFHNENNKMNSISRPNNFKKNSGTHVGQSQPSESYPISWIQSKLPSSSLHSNDVANNTFVPSLPTLVGDLALGTNYPLPSNENIHKNKTLPHLTACGNEFAKPNTVEGNISSDKLQEKLQHPQQSNRDSINKEVSSIKDTVYENCSSSQLSAGTFLSVSQLVDQANSSSGTQRDHSISHHGNLFIHRMELPSKQGSFEMQPSEIYPLPSAELKHNNNVSSGPHSLAVKSINQNINVKLNNDHSLQTRVEPTTNRKIETNQGMSNNNQYRASASNTMISVPPPSNGNLNFCASFNTQTTLSVSSSHIPWSTPIDITKQPISKGSSTNCKTSVSSYSAEALIGLNSINSNERVSNSAHESVGSKIVMLPAPAVSERFATTQFPPPQPPPPPLPTSVSRGLQMPPFTGDAILSNNYFPPVALSSHSQDMCLNESDQTMNSWRNLTPHIYRDQQDYKNLNTADNSPMIPSSTGQSNSELLKHSKFIPSVGTSHSHHSLTTRSLPCNFLPDLGPTNSYKSSLLSDTVNPFIFPPPVSSSTTKGSVMHGEKLPVNSHVIVSSSSSTFYSENSIRSLGPIVTSSAAVNNKSQSLGNSSVQCNNKTNTSHRGTNCNSSNHLSNMGNIPCNPPKQRARKRVSDSVAPSSSANVGSLMDLAYLGVPPMMGSPMIADESVYVNHPPTFLNSGSSHTSTSLYPAVPPSSQGTFYSTPHCTGPPGSYISVSHPNHLVNNSSCSDAINSRVPTNNPTVSPIAVNSSSSSLTNFNLSTIFPEINEKVI